MIFIQQSINCGNDFYPIELNTNVGTKEKRFSVVENRVSAEMQKRNKEIRSRTDTGGEMTESNKEFWLGYEERQERGTWNSQAV